MSFTDFFIKRPVFATALSLMLLVVGLLSFTKLNVRQFPKIDANLISISTTYPGASASLVESFVTTPIENAISGVDGIDYITSSSSTGKSTIILHLQLNADINAAMVDVNSDLSSVIKKLPSTIDSPVVSKVESDAVPEMILTFSSHSLSPEAIADYLTRTVQPVLSNLPGVGSADILGKRTYAMRIWLDPKRMNQLGITGTDIQNALNNNNVQSQPGEVDRAQQILSINANTDLKTAEDFAQIPLKTVGNTVVQLKDVAHVTLGSTTPTDALLIDNKFAVGMAITPKSSANPLDVATAVKAALPNIQHALPADLTLSIPRDNSIYIQQSIDEVNHAIIESIVCVFIVIWGFLGSWRSVLIPMATIPLSLLGACLFMFLLGYTLNTLTLLAFVLAIGMVVDDAIVVLENIHRHIETGSTPLQAALKGAREIVFAVIAMTFTLAAVYAPIGFAGGLTGALFKEFAFTLAGTVVISGFIALTLSPMMCTKFLKHTEPNRFAIWLEKNLHHITTFYQATLTTVLSMRPVVVISTGALFICGLLFFWPLYKTCTLAPDEDQSVIMGIVSGPTSANLAYTERYTAELSQLLAMQPEHRTIAVINGRPSTQNSAMAFMELTDWSERKRSVDDMIADLTPKTQSISGVRVMLLSPPPLPTSTDLYPIEIVIKTTGSYEALNHVAEEIVQTAEKNPGILRASSDLKLDKPELTVDINRAKAATLGISMNDISTALNIAFGEPETTTFTKNGITYDVIPEVGGLARDNPNKINYINLKTSGGSIPLSSVVTIRNTVAPETLNHFQQQRAATISAILSPSYSTKEALQYFQTLANHALQSGMSLDYAGDSRSFLQNGHGMGTLFAFALIFIYLVLAAQFESLTDPFIVLFSVPLSLVGAFATLYFTRGSLNIYTEIGLITLIGLISKHGILIVEFANQLQKTGLSVRQAVIKAASIRLRPILMTTAAMALGAIPLVLASGAGANARSQMGLVILGGMLIGTCFTLFVVPTAYTFLARRITRQD